MAVSAVNYTVPELQTLTLGEYDVAPEFTPESTVLDKGAGKGLRYWRPYRACYLDRLTLDTTIKSKNERKKVNLLSLCPIRVNLVGSIIRDYLEGRPNTPDFPTIERVLNWIDRDHRSEELHNTESARHLYRNYTDGLRHSLRLSNVGENSNATPYSGAQTSQSALAYLCARACDINIVLVQSWAIRITHRNSSRNELPAPTTTAKEHALAYALHQRFFDAFSQAILNKTPPPVIVNLEDLGFKDLIYYNQHANSAGGWTFIGRNDWKPYFYRREGVFEGKLKAFNALLAEHGINPIKGTAFKALQDNNRSFSKGSLIELANHSTRHFGYLLLAEAGCNADHLASIDFDEARLNKALGLSQTRAIKSRAGFEDQDQFVDVRFVNTTWKQYRRLRDWKIAHLDSPPKRGLFLLGTGKGGVEKRDFFLLHATAMRVLPFWPTEAPSLASRTARKHKTVNLLEGSGGNIAMVAALQSATDKTIERHYAFKNRVEAAESMCRYFEAQARSTELRYNGVEPVRIIEGGESIKAGRCDEEGEGPQLIDGFKELGIVPRCSAPITCLFCIHFGIHASVADLLTILTMNQWIQIQSRIRSMNIDDHFSKFLPYHNRIQQILDGLTEINTEVASLVTEAQACFERGDYDHYWRAKINAMLEMEEV